MDEIELDERQAAFIAGWFAARGVQGRPTLAEFSEALAALVDFGFLSEPDEGEEYAAIRLN